MKGLVTKTTGSAYAVKLDDGTMCECHIKGNFRIRGVRTTNPVAVGDRVQVEDCWITDIEERKNYIIRRSTNLSKESHILAANIDQVALIVTINHPETSTTFIDRYIATCEAYRVPVVLIFNKVDLLTPDETIQLNTLRKLYEDIGYATLSISAKSGNCDEVRNILGGKKTLLSGNSGVGKSTLLNALFGREVTRTGLISSAHDKGMHTTTFSEMYFLNSGAVIDTPGIKGFGAIDMQREEVSHYFREIFHIGQNCRFGNCTHTGEPGCAVQEAVVNGAIALTRYESYLSVLGDCNEKKYR